MEQGVAAQDLAGPLQIGAHGFAAAGQRQQHLPAALMGLEYQAVDQFRHDPGVFRRADVAHPLGPVQAHAGSGNAAEPVRQLSGVPGRPFGGGHRPDFVHRVNGVGVALPLELGR